MRDDALGAFAIWCLGAACGLFLSVIIHLLVK
jgi:hypothetical protein